MSLVSVIIPAYNQGHYLHDAIESALVQTHGGVEVIVVDDGSIDETADVVRTFSDNRVQYIYQENQGLSAARNTGIRNASGEYLSFLDADDLFLPTKLEDLLNVMDAAPEGGLVAGEAIPINEDGVKCGRTFNKRVPEQQSEWLLGNPLHVGSVVLHRRWQDRVGYFDIELKSYEDWDMWIRLARAGCPIRWVPKPVSLYRFHTQQMTRDGTQMTTANFMVLEKVFADPDLPADWRDLKPVAYSFAHLRAAAHAYLVKDYPRASEHLAEAVQLNPGLLRDHGRALADQFSAWTELPKTNEPLEFLAAIYANLPENVKSIMDVRDEMGDSAMKIAFESADSGDWRTAGDAVRIAVRNKPSWVMNRGALSIFVKGELKRMLSRVNPSF